MNPALSQFLDHMEKLSKECQRRMDIVNHELIFDIYNRLKYCTEAFKEIDQAIINGDFSCVMSRNDRNVLIQSFSELCHEWKLKLDNSEVNDRRRSHENLKATTTKNGKRGRPVYELHFEAIKEFVSMRIPITKIASILGIHRSTIYRHLGSNGIEISRYKDICDDKLDSVIKDIKNTHPSSGERLIEGFLDGRGIRVTRERLRASIHRVDPINTALRWVRKTPRHVYSVPGPNSLWHNDGCHKMIHWRIVIHACIDGYSRIITSLICADNNRAKTALDAFLSGVEEWSLPSRVRGDHGTENNDIERFMKSNRGDGGYIRGPSVHNQRIERLHYDTKYSVLSYYINLFYFMEEEGILIRNDELDLYSLHFVYLKRIQNSLDEFKNAWNCHRLSTEKNMTPYQIWILGMADCNNENQRAVRDFVHNNQLLNYGVEGDVTAVIHRSMDSVEIRRIDIGEKQSEISAFLKTKYNPLDNDGNHGIDIFLRVKTDVIANL